MKNDDLITVLTLPLPQDAAIIKGRLESEGIECFLKDELTVQVDNFYSNALGGVKLQVKESDSAKAIKILKDTGYINEQDLQPSKMWMQLDKSTSNIPLLNKLSVEIRVIIILTAFILLVIRIIFIFLEPNSQNGY
jgi:hypothetical protein